jgi:Ca2+/Na+ antiporter
MELDDLKSIWKGNLFEAKQAEEIAAMLKGRSKLTIAKLKRSVRFELLLTIGFGLVLLYLAFTLRSGAMKWSIVSMVLLFLAYIIYYVMKMRVLNRFNPSQQNIRENLEKLISSMEAYLKFYKTSYTVLYPVYLLLGILFAALERGFDTFWHQLAQPETILRLTLVSLAVLAGSLLFSKWYLKKLYGNHLDSLKELLRDIKDDAR